MTGPLAGVRVIDMTQMLAGPFATMLLADLGADVVKVEPPAGDFTRGSYVRDPDNPDGLAGYFQSVNRGKSSVVLDLKQRGAKDAFLTLVKDADLLVENFAAGTMERLGLSYEELAKINPRLVYGAIRGFGDARTGESPMVGWPAYDVIAQAMSGYLSISGTEDGVPIKSGPGIGDIFPAVLLAIGVLGALRHAERTGEGQFVDVAMYDAMLLLCERIVYQYSYTGAVPKQEGNGHPSLAPFDILPAKDGWVAIAAPQDSQWQTLAGLIGRPDLALSERFAARADRVRNRAEVRRLLVDWLSDRTMAEAQEVLGGVVPFGPVNTAAEIFTDPHVQARNMLVQVEQPGSEKRAVIAGQPIKFTRTGADVLRRGPLLGEDEWTDIAERWSGRVGVDSATPSPASV